MGEALYAAAEDRYGDFPLRVYAPVGGHEDLLPYLVRRLLENGANTSFVHALLDEKTPVSKVVVDPITAVEGEPAPARTRRIPPAARPLRPEPPHSGGPRPLHRQRARPHDHASSAWTGDAGGGPIVGGGW